MTFTTKFKATVLMHVLEGEGCTKLSDCEVTELEYEDYYEGMEEMFGWSMPDSLTEFLYEEGKINGYYEVEGTLTVTWHEDYFGEIDQEICWDVIVKEVK